jgi:hypothetical protein
VVGFAVGIVAEFQSFFQMAFVDFANRQYFGIFDSGRSLSVHPRRRTTVRRVRPRRYGQSPIVSVGTVTGREYRGAWVMALSRPRFDRFLMKYSRHVLLPKAWHRKTPSVSVNRSVPRMSRTG